MARARISEELSDLVEHAIDRFTQPDEIVGWDIVWHTQLGPQGGFHTLTILVLSVRHPLLGQPPIVGTQPFDWPLADQPFVNELVSSMVAALRGGQAQIRQGAN